MQCRGKACNAGEPLHVLCVCVCSPLVSAPKPRRLNFQGVDGRRGEDGYRPTMLVGFQHYRLQWKDKRSGRGRGKEAGFRASRLGFQPHRYQWKNWKGGKARFKLSRLAFQVQRFSGKGGKRLDPDWQALYFSISAP